MSIFTGDNDDVPVIGNTPALSTTSEVVPQEEPESHIPVSSLVAGSQEDSSMINMPPIHPQIQSQVRQVSGN